MIKKSILDHFFYFPLEEKHFLFKGMVAMYDLNNWDKKSYEQIKIKYKNIRDLALKEINNVSILQTRNENDPQYTNILLNWSKRLSNSFYASFFAQKGKLDEYYQYLMNIVQPTTTELMKTYKTPTELETPNFEDEPPF